MSGDMYVNLAREMFLATLKLGGPILAVALVVGVALSIVQAVTQVQEMTLTFVPKVACIAVTVLIAGPWMLRSLVSFTQRLFERLPDFVQ